MERDLRASKQIAQQYLHIATPPERLGWGLGGHVYMSPDFRRAVKVHRRQEGYSTELDAYNLLHQRGITEVHGCTIPKLRGYENDLMVIEMDLVKPPFLLDFAGVQFNPPDFSDDVNSEWRRQIDAAYHPNQWLVYSIYESLAKEGLYYTDFRQSNLNLSGHPSAVFLPPEELSESDDF